MLHPSYTEIIDAVNSEVEPGEAAGRAESLFDCHCDRKARETVDCGGKLQRFRISRKSLSPSRLRSFTRVR